MLEGSLELTERNQQLQWENERINFKAKLKDIQVDVSEKEKYIIQLHESLQCEIEEKQAIFNDLQAMKSNLGSAVDVAEKL